MVREVIFTAAKGLKTQKGYGVIPRAAMADPYLCISAKVIYAYYCAAAGQGRGSFPKRKDIIRNLGIGRTTYYRNFSELQFLGYLKAEQISDANGTGQKSTVEILDFPGRFTLKAPVYLQRTWAKVLGGGITAAGYGFIDKKVLLDSRISIKAKALYAYYASFTEGDTLDIPRKEVVMLHLGMTKEVYLGAMKQLFVLGYLKGLEIPDKNLL